MAMLNTAFFKKEIKEFFKTPKFIILILVFAFFAILSPVSARYINEIIASLSPDIQISFPDPVFQDSWIQIYKNITSLCLIVLLIIVTGTIAQEKSKGSILLVLTKKVSRFNFIFSKFMANVVIFTIIYLVAIILGVVYTQILFSTFSYDGMIISIVLIWFLGIFYIALAIFTSVISKTPTVAALLGFVGYAVFNLFNIAQSIQKFNPAGSASLVNNILAGTSSSIDNWLCLISTVLGSTIILGLAYMIFKKQEI